MEVSKDEIIKKLAQEGKDRAEVRRQLISMGLSTEGFETQYEIYAKDAPQAPRRTPREGEILGDFESFETRTSKSDKFRSRSKRLYLIILIVIAVIIFLFVQGFIDTTKLGIDKESIESTKQSLNIGDKLLQGKVESTFASVQLFGRRMGSFGGVCQDVIVLDPVRCLETPESAVVYAPMGEKGYYCIDIAGFRGTVENRPSSGESCQ